MESRFDMISDETVSRLDIGLFNVFLIEKQLALSLFSGRSMILIFSVPTWRILLLLLGVFAVAGLS